MADFPAIQGIELYEHYEASGNLLHVTSDRSLIKAERGDFVIRRPWATAAPGIATEPRFRTGGSDD